ncbi:cupin domain-containing protein [Radiobacillus sp. PE A8.2]|uniref:cupin domain-containing protein n=1 Tax=Radiobacillus sp. PE A8.2 TaxID=3380349 RepID=UPI00388F1C71
MITTKETKVLQGDKMKWAPMPDHINLYHREIVSAQEADDMGISASSFLWELIDVGGQVRPHYHDVAEIIHITKGKVKVLCNGEWKSYQAGDTIQVPAGAIHSVANDDVEATEQLSVFIPVQKEQPKNAFFHTVIVEADNYPKK